LASGIGDDTNEADIVAVTQSFTTIEEAFSCLVLIGRFDRGIGSLQHEAIVLVTVIIFVVPVHTSILVRAPSIRRRTGGPIFC
jgi:hypothetical protein